MILLLLPYFYVLPYVKLLEYISIVPCLKLYIVLWGMKTVTVVTYQTYIVVKFDYLKKNKCKIPPK